jgi:hypothetical protein
MRARLRHSLALFLAHPTFQDEDMLNDAFKLGREKLEMLSSSGE